MAKGKHSRALFEVIKQTQERQQQERRDAAASAFSTTAPPATRTSWLSFLRRPAIGAGPSQAKPVVSKVVYRELPPNAESDANRVDAATVAQDEAGSPETDPHAAEGPPPAGNGEAEPVVAAERSLLCESSDEREALATGDAVGPRREVHLTLSYTGIGIASAAAVLLLCTAFLIGKHFARPAYPGNGPSLAQIKNSKALPDVLNVGSASPKASLTGTPESADQVEAGSGTTDAPPPQIAAPATSDDPAAPAGANDTKRVANRNYIIAQSYPDRETADKAADLLNRNDIPVSVEKLDYAPGWFCVVTRVGFDRVKTSEYERYEKLIRDVNVQAAQVRLKKFDPYPYKWK